MGATGYIIKNNGGRGGEAQKEFVVSPADGTIDVEKVETFDKVDFRIKTTYDGYETINVGSLASGGYFKAAHIKFNEKNRRYRLVCILNGGSYTPVAKDFAIYYIKFGWRTGGVNADHWYIEEYSRQGNGAYVSLEQIALNEYNVLIHTPTGYAYANIGILKEDKEPDVTIDHFNNNTTRYTPTGTIIETDTPAWKNGALVDTNPEDLEIRNGLLQLADRSSSNGLGYVILRPDKTFAEQVVQTNTVYEVRYNFDLGGGSVTIPSNCTLKFEGGRLYNGTINGNDTELIDCSFYQCDFLGSFTSNDAKLSWFNSESDDNSVISTMKLASKCSGNTADFEGISKNITAPIVVSQDMVCNIKNANFTFNPTAENQCLFVFDTDVQGNGDRYMVDCIFTQNSSSTFKGVSCLHYKNWKNYNGAIWRNIRVNNFTGYFFVNSSYFQEALIENVVCQSTAGFISYDTNNVYSDRKGSSNIVTIINSSLNGSADTAKYSAVMTANDLYDCMQIDYINCVFQGRLYGGKNSFTIGSGTNSTYTPIVTFNKVWIEYVNKKSGVYDISIESGCKLNITANPLSINVGSNDVCIDYNALGIAYTDNIIDNIHFDEGVYIAELNINSNQHSRDYSLNLEKIVNWMNRGIMVSFNSKVCYGTLSSNNVIRTSGHIRKYNCFNYINYIANNYIPKRNNVNISLDKVDGVNVVVLENDGVGTVGFKDYPWLLCGESFIKPKMTIIVDVIYRVTPLSTITEENKTSIYYRPPIKFENASYKEYFEVGDVGGVPKNWVRTTIMNALADASTSGSFITRNELNVVGCKMEIAMLNIYFHHAHIEEIIAIDSENNKLIKLSTNDPITINNSGVTDKRPILTANFSGFQYFDTDLGKPIYWTGAKWVDANGNDLQ